MASVIGFRFHPTDEELVNYYLLNKNFGREKLVRNAINEINFRSFDPWDMPSQAKIQSDDDRCVWYFFCPRDRFSSSSARSRRTTKNGYWKATGRDRKIRVPGSSRHEAIGIKKTLVFYKGRVPNGIRTSWVVHEYHPSVIPSNKRTYVICKLKNKASEINPTPTSCGVEESYPPPPESENHASVDATNEAFVQEEDSHLESLYEFDRFDDGLGFHWNEQVEGIPPLDIKHLIDSSYNNNAAPSQEITPSDFPCLVDEIDGQDDEFVNSLLADQDDGSTAEETTHSLEPLPGLYPVNNTNTVAETLDSGLNIQEISSSVNDGPIVAKERQELLEQESSLGSGFFDSVFHPELIHFAAKECPENSPRQGNLLEKGASGKKVETPTQAPSYTSTYDSDYNYSELIHNPSSTKAPTQIIHEKYSNKKQKFINEKCRFDSAAGRLIELLLDKSQISVTLKIPLHVGAGVSLKTFPERILPVFVNRRMQIPVEKITDKYLRKYPYPATKPATLITRCVWSTARHCKVPKGSLISAKPRRQVVRKSKHGNPANAGKFKHTKRTWRCTNLTYPNQNIFKCFEKRMLRPVLQKRVPAIYN